MPFLNVKVSGKKTSEMNKQISQLLFESTSNILKKKRNLISIAIEYIDPNDWFIAGNFLSELNQSSFYLFITITDETNTKDEKAKYIKEVFAGFEKLLGKLHQESYIYIQDARATTYGYGGLTQEYRYQHLK